MAKKIQDHDTLIAWRDKYNESVNDLDSLKNRLDALETGGVTDGELIALRHSTSLDYEGATAGERIENTEQHILANMERIESLENRDLKLINVRDKGAMGDGVTDDSAAIQQALDEAYANGGGEVYIPAGTYALKATLLIYSNTRVRCDMGAKIIRAARISNLIRSGIGNVPAYDGVQNVEIIGGTWDFNAEQFPSPGSHFMFGHCENIIIRDATILNVYNNHHIEFNAVRGGRVLNCIIKGYYGTRTATEAIQLDLMKSATQFSHYGLYDNTTCDDILIQGCWFEDLCRGIGSHSATKGFYHTNIRIVDNHFKNLTAHAILGYQYLYCDVIGNTFEDCQLAVELRPGVGADASECGYYTIQGNVVTNMRGESNSYGIWLNGDPGVRILFSTVTGNVINGTSHDGIKVDYNFQSVVQGNTIRNAGRHGISSVGTQFSVFSSNTISESGQIGLSLNDSSDNVVVGNLSRDNQKNDTDRGNIQLGNKSDRNNVQANTCRGGADYGIYVTSTCNNNFVTNNDLRTGGKVMPFRNSSSTTVTSAGNLV